MTYSVSRINNIQIHSGDSSLYLPESQQGFIELQARIKKLIATKLFQDELGRQFLHNSNEEINLKVRITGNDVSITGLDKDTRQKKEVRYTVIPNDTITISNTLDFKKAAKANRKILKKANDIYQSMRSGSEGEWQGRPRKKFQQGQAFRNYERSLSRSSSSSRDGLTKREGIPFPTTNKQYEYDASSGNEFEDNSPSKGSSHLGHGTQTTKSEIENSSGKTPEDQSITNTDLRKRVLVGGGAKPTDDRNNLINDFQKNFEQIRKNLKKPPPVEKTEHEKPAANELEQAKSNLKDPPPKLQQVNWKDRNTNLNQAKLTQPPTQPQTQPKINVSGNLDIPDDDEYSDKMFEEYEASIKLLDTDFRRGTNVGSHQEKVFSNNNFKTEVEKSDSQEEDSDLETDNETNSDPETKKDDSSDEKNLVNERKAQGQTSEPEQHPIIKAETNKRKTQNTLPDEPGTDFPIEDQALEKKEELRRQIEQEKLALAAMPKQESSNPIMEINKVLVEQLRDMTLELNTLRRQRELWAKENKTVDTQIHHEVFNALVAERKAEIDKMKKTGFHIHLDEQLIKERDQANDERDEALAKVSKLQKELDEAREIAFEQEDQINELKKPHQVFANHPIESSNTHPASQEQIKKPQQVEGIPVQIQAENPQKETNEQKTEQAENQQEKKVSAIPRNFNQRIMQNESSSSEEELKRALEEDRTNKWLTAERQREARTAHEINKGANEFANVQDKVKYFKNQIHEQNKARKHQIKI